MVGRSVMKGLVVVLVNGEYYGRTLSVCRVSSELTVTTGMLVEDEEWMSVDDKNNTWGEVVVNLIMRSAS